MIKISKLMSMMKDLQQFIRINNTLSILHIKISKIIAQLVQFLMNKSKEERN